MKERLHDIPTADGRMPAFATWPEEGGPFPVVVLFMDIWGVREELFDIARRIGTVGYYTVVPDLYYRQGQVHYESRNDRGQMLSLAKVDEELRKKVLAAGGKLSDAMVADDVGALLSFLAKGEPARTDRIGSVGYCMGGRHVFVAAGHYPDSFIAGASLHGTALVTDKPDSPHLLGEAFRGEMYCGFGELDHYAPPPVIRTLADHLGRCRVAYRYEVHPGADHGYALPDRDIYDKRAAMRDWEIIFAMWRRRLQD